MPNFSRRSNRDEMMDDFLLGADTINPIMDELEVINKLLGGYSVFLNALEKIGLRNGLSISDWGCGGGDSLRVLADWAKKKKLDLALIGVDATAAALDYAKKKSANYPTISYIHADVLSNDLKKNQFDIVISSLFSHHFQDEHWIKLIQKMLDCSTTAVIVNDLHRHWFAYHSIGLLTRLFSRSEMVKHDSKVSVMRSFSRRDLETLLQRAEVKKYSIRWMWAFRWQLIIYK